QGWAGVLMPSVDRVGRYFPFTIAVPLGHQPDSQTQMTALWQWLGRADELAADAMQDDWSVERLESELARMAGPDLLPSPLPAANVPARDGELAEQLLAPGLDAAARLGFDAHGLWRAQAAGMAWWYASPETLAPRLLQSRGLPAAAALQTLLGATI
ncbi:MAG: type VI secretion system-associated protein TagF, partial [Rubrivivax sp.]|nr:type VI secretion system-associated protein TagF [Rubrivivax sp.]